MTNLYFYVLIFLFNSFDRAQMDVPWQLLQEMKLSDFGMLLAPLK